jgi:hypothetical protein
MPRALAGSTLSVAAGGYVSALISGWSGQELELRLEREEVQR